MKRNQKGFAPIFFILVLAAVVGVIYLFRFVDLGKTGSVSVPLATSNDNNFKPIYTTAPTVRTNATISKVNDTWMLYKNLTYNFSFEFPGANGVNLSDDNLQIEYPAPLSGGAVQYNSDISVSYITNTQKLSLDKLLENSYYSDPFYKNAGVSSDQIPEGYQKFSPEGNNIQVYINRTAPGADTNQDFYVLSPNGNFGLRITCFFGTSEVNHILSTLKFD